MFPNVVPSFRQVLSWTSALVLAGSGSAQGFNVDIGTLNPTPSNAYAGAAAQGGFWNPLVGPAQVPLIDLNGAPSAATLRGTSGCYDCGSNHPSTSGEDELLLDDGNFAGLGLLQFDGLVNGDYDVYTYAWHPGGWYTRVRVTGSSDPDQLVGGTWTGSHVQGVTFAKHHVFVYEGWLQVEIHPVQGYAFVNGVQIVPTGPPASVYCTAKTTSNGCVPYIGSTGTASASATSGFRVRVTNTINNKAGLYLYSNSAPVALPFQGGTLCIGSPVRRTPAMHSYGNLPPANDCSGIFIIDFNFFAHGGLGGSPAPYLTVPGTIYRVQAWGRDPGFPQPLNTQLSNALEVTVGP